MRLKIYKIFFVHLFCLLFCACSMHSSDNQEVSREAQHRTKVWILERYPAIEHPLVSELFERSLTRLLGGAETLKYRSPDRTQTRIYLLDSNEISAFSLCDGSIFLTKEIIKATPSLNELMAIIAHELSHVIRRDACYLNNEDQKEKEIENEFAADAMSAQILYHSYIDPEAALFGLSLTARNYSQEKNPSFSESITARKTRLLEQVGKYPKINSKIPEERLFRKVKSILATS